MLDSLGKKIGKLYSLNGDKPNKAYLKNIVVYEKKTPGPEPIPPREKYYAYKLLDIDENGMVSCPTGELPKDYYEDIVKINASGLPYLYSNCPGLTGEIWFPNVTVIDGSGLLSAYSDYNIDFYFPKLQVIGEFDTFLNTNARFHFPKALESDVTANYSDYGLSLVYCIFDL